LIQDDRTRVYKDFERLGEFQVRIDALDGAQAWAARLELPREKAPALLGIAKGLLEQAKSQ